MKHLLKKCLCLLLLASSAHAAAQITPAWTRQLTPAHWKVLADKTVFTAGKSPFLDLSRRVATAARVKTTDENLLRHKIFYSNLFSHLEKDILLDPTYPQATLGKVAYLHDKHAAFFNNLHARASGHVDTDAFFRHQTILTDVLGALQNYYQAEKPFEFANEVFSKEEIARQQTLPAQPAAYALTPAELHEFAALPNQNAQRQWADQKIFTATLEVSGLLNKATQDLTPADFDRYYRGQTRLSYFKLLASVLEKADAKRASAIVRYKLPLDGQTGFFTDAQRGGMLRFELDTRPSTKAAERFEQFEQDYGTYAAAEALGAPYEIALQRGDVSPELLGQQEGKYWLRLTHSECMHELQPKMAQLEEELEKMRTQTPQGPDFYAQYYRLYSRLKIYHTLLARAKFFLRNEL